MNGYQIRPGDRAAAVAIDPDRIDTIATDRRLLTADPAEPGLSRRGLLAAAGGIALATSGLLVPEWLVEEAAAGEKRGRRVQDHTNPRRRYDHRVRSLDSRFPLELCDPYLLLRRVRAAGDV